MLIAQLSDIHAAPDNDNLARLHRAIDWLQTLQPDLLVVSGDLTDDGWQEGYVAIDEALQRLNCRTHIIPGNADDKAAMRASLPAFARHTASDAMHFCQQLNGVAVIGVDVTVAGESRGDIRPHLPWLKNALAASPQPALLFLHQHLFPCGIAPLDSAMCDGGPELSQLINSLPFPPLALCSGHVHRPMSATFAGVPAFICGSICPANPLMLDAQHLPPVTDPAALMIHQIRNGRLVSHFVSAPQSLN